MAHKNLSGDSDMAKNITEKVIELITAEPAHLCCRVSGFSSSSGVLESPVYPTISALHYID